MKKLLVLALLAMTSTTFAGTCKISARIYESLFACPTISFSKMKDMSLQACEAQAQRAIDTNLFGVLDIKNNERILHLNYKFKEGRYKVKDRIVISEWTEDCGAGIL